MNRGILSQTVTGLAYMFVQMSSIARLALRYAEEQLDLAEKVRSAHSCKKQLNTWHPVESPTVHVPLQTTQCRVNGNADTYRSAKVPQQGKDGALLCGQFLDADWLPMDIQNRDLRLAASEIITHTRLKLSLQNSLHQICRQVASPTCGKGFGQGCR